MAESSATCQIENASLASQAVGPPTSQLEMSCAGRTLPRHRQEAAAHQAAALQDVDPTDSMLGPFASATAPASSSSTLRDLIKKAFDPKYWSAAGRWRIVNGQLVKRSDGIHPDGAELLHVLGHLDHALRADPDLGPKPVRQLVRELSARGGAGAGDANAVPLVNPTVNCQPSVDNPNTSTNPVDHGLSEQEVLGFALFFAPGNPRAAGNPACGTCHGPLANSRAASGVVFPVLSEAAFTSGQTNPFTPVERSLLNRLSETYDSGTGLVADVAALDQQRGGIHDRGFFNIGVTPSGVDLGNGGTDPYGNPLALTRMFLATESGGTAVDPLLVVTPATATTGTLAQPLDFSGALNRCSAPGLHEPGGTPLFPGCAAGAGGPFAPPVPVALPLAPLLANAERELVDGGFKTPSLRNVGLTAPYFHSGNYSDLRSVVQFYARGGSRRKLERQLPR